MQKSFSPNQDGNICNFQGCLFLLVLHPESFTRLDFTIPSRLRHQLLRTTMNLQAPVRSDW